MNNANPVVDGILGGWSGIGEYQSGSYIRLGTVLVSGNPKLDNPTGAKWFDTSRISIQPPYTTRTKPVQWPAFTGPRYGNLDLTLAKTHKMTEKIGLEVRLEACSATNSFMSAGPNTSVTSANFGKITSQRNRSFGRQVQYMAWLRW